MGEILSLVPIWAGPVIEFQINRKKYILESTTIFSGFPYLRSPLPMSFWVLGKKCTVLALWRQNGWMLGFQCFLNCFALANEHTVHELQQLIANQLVICRVLYVSQVVQDFWTLNSTSHGWCVVFLLFLFVWHSELNKHETKKNNN